MSAVEPLHFERVPDDDEVLMPESDEHRRLRDLIAVAATRALGPDHRVFSNLSDYPGDRANPVGPDAMVVPAAAVPPGRVRSYRQGHATDGRPRVAVEIPSSSDSAIDLRGKLRRYQRLGIVSYVVYADEDDPQVVRLSDIDLEPQRWTGQAIDELGGISFVVDEGELRLRTQDGIVVSDSVELIAYFERQAQEARDQAGAARGQADQLRAQLRAAGIEPTA